MSLAAPPIFRLERQQANHLTLSSDQGDAAHLFVLEDDIIRLMVLPGGRFSGLNSWAIAPGADDVPASGRDRFDLSGFALPAFALEVEAGTLRIRTSRLQLSVRLAGLHCTWSMAANGAWREIARDRPTQAYDFGWWDGRPRHYLRRAGGEAYFGLGERSGEMNRAGRRYRLSNLDAMGYSARTSDPLYKSIPFYITATPADGAAFGLFYDTLSDCEFDFGQELDNYHGPYRGFVAEHGDLDYYVIAGPGVDQVARRFTWMTGRPMLPPTWSLGYSGSTMSYTDAPDAQARMGEFIDRCAEHDILCDSFHLSSGYSSIGDKRYVFTWNRDKFPDPAAFVRDYADRGVRLCANIKPCLLRDHPLFAEAAAKRLLIADAEGQPAWVQFWDEIGAYLDFTNPDTVDWWKHKVRASLLDLGVAATWNDNNEFEIPTPNAIATGFGTPRPAWEAKPLQTLLMLRASRDAQVEQAPGKRPFLVSRAGAVGMHRYAQSWSGDNSTSWETLKYNLKMGLGLGLSGVSNFGHDIGGFAGPAPAAELLVRWVQFGLFLPRFSIHSWNDDGTVNEPWMYPRATPFIRDLIKLRYRLIPYLYDLLWRYHRDFEPVTRPTFYDFPGDPRCWEPGDEMMLGANLLIAPVVEPGVAERAVYLPAGTGWIDVWTGQRFDGGQCVTRPAPWDQPVMFAREGSAIPVNLAEQQFAKRAARRGFWVFPHAGEGWFATETHEDDGLSTAYRDGGFGGWRLEVSSNAEAIETRLEPFGSGFDRAGEVELVFPANEGRMISPLLLP